MRWKTFSSSGSKPKIFVPERIAGEKEPAPAVAPRKEWPAVVGALAQVGVLLVVAIGYLFTVRPVFQHQLLQEKAARLELEQSEIESEIRDLRDERSAVELEIAGLKEQLQQERLKGQELSEFVLEVQANERAARDRVDSLRSEVSEELAALEAARWELMLTDIFTKSVFMRLPLNLEITRESSSMAEYIDRQRETWPDPNQSLMSLVEGIEARNAERRKFPPEMIAELRNLIIEKRDQLVCNPPDFDAIKERHRQETIGIDALVNEKTERRISEIVDEFRDRGEEVIITDEFRAVTERSYRIGEEYRISSKYKEEIRVLREQCESVVLDVVREIERQKGLGK